MEALTLLLIAAFALVWFVCFVRVVTTPINYDGVEDREAGE